MTLALDTTLRKDELCKLRWLQIDFMNQTLTVGRSKTEAGKGRVIPLNADAFEAMLEWQARFPDAEPEHYIIPFCEPKHKAVDPTRPSKG